MTRKIPLIAHDLKRLYTGFLLAAVLLFAVCTYDYDLGYVSLEVYENGAPRLYWHQERRNQPNGGVQSVVFSGVDLRQGEWIHLAVTFDPEKDTVSCYINGVLVSTVEDCEF